MNAPTNDGLGARDSDESRSQADSRRSGVGLPSSASILDDLRRDLATYETTVKPRALQVETGASGLYGCIAEAIYRLRGTEAAERMSWPAVVGTAIHEYLAEVLPKMRDGVICEQRFVYRDVPATVDYLEPGLLIDWKTRDDSESIEDIVSDGPPVKWIAQVQLGAAAAREAGHVVDHVALVVLPRSGSLDDAQVFGPYEFDQELADAAAEWSHDVDNLAADATVDPRDHRGQPAFWCWEFCPFVSECRGEREAVDLDELAPVAEAYRETLDTRDAAIAKAKQLRPLIPIGTKGLAGRAQISYSPGGTGKDVEEEDVDALRDLWRFVNGEELPTRTVTKPGSSPRLVVKWKDKP